MNGPVERIIAYRDDGRPKSWRQRLSWLVPAWRSPALVVIKGPMTDAIAADSIQVEITDSGWLRAL
jgi:hypothetical protein